MADGNKQNKAESSQKIYCKIKKRCAKKNRKGPILGITLIACNSKMTLNQCYPMKYENHFLFDFF